MLSAVQRKKSKGIRKPACRTHEFYPNLKAAASSVNAGIVPTTKSGEDAGFPLFDG
jgi:hypothetical protein